MGVTAFKVAAAAVCVIGCFENFELSGLFQNGAHFGGGDEALGIKRNKYVFGFYVSDEFAEGQGGFLTFIIGRTVPVGGYA